MAGLPSLRKSDRPTYDADKKWAPIPMDPQNLFNIFSQ